MGLNSVFEAKGEGKEQKKAEDNERFKVQDSEELEDVDEERKGGCGSVLDELGFRRIGYCFTGSFCTLSRSLEVLRGLAGGSCEIVPIMSENVYFTDTRFWRCEQFSAEVERITGRRIIHTVTEAERLGPFEPLEALIVSPCTGNTLAKLVHGITDTAATMAIKAHLRADRPTLLGICTNDALSQNLSGISFALNRKSVYLLPMRQDSPEGKPHSLVAELERTEEAIHALRQGKQLRPLFV